MDTDGNGSIDDVGGWDRCFVDVPFLVDIGTGLTPVAPDDPRLPDPDLGAGPYRERHPHDHGIVRRLP